MIQPFSLPLLKRHFPSQRRPTPGVFELAIACCGGTATGPYVAGVLDFLWEAFEEWRRAAAKGEAPNHQVRVRYLAGTSAGGLSLGLALLATLKDFPHVYDDRLWARYAPDPTTPQPKEANPHYRAWVAEIGLAELLADPDEVKSGQIFLFHDAPERIGRIVLGMAAAAPDAKAPRDWVCHPLELRATVGNLEGVPYALEFDRLAAPAGAVTTEYFLAHRDCVAFAAATNHLGAAPTGLGDPPDCYGLPRGAFDGGPPAAAAQGRELFTATMNATSAIPLVFQVQPIPQDPTVYDWRAAYWDVARRAAVVDPPTWPSKPAAPLNFDATDGGLFDNQPFDIAHERLAGVRGANPQAGDKACRAVLLIDPLARDDQPTPANPVAGNVFDVVARLVLSPVDQDRLDTLDLAQIRDETIFSRFMIAPSRRSPRAPHRAWPPSKSLMGAPLDAFLGFAARAYREHDFLLGRRNAQQFLRRTFALPATNPLVAGGGWGRDEFVEDGVTYRPLVPLRGRAADVQPEPDWPWGALTDRDIDRYKDLAGARADAIFVNLKAGVVKAAGALGGVVVWPYLTLGWCFGARKTLLDTFRSRLAQARHGLEPSAPGR